MVRRYRHISELTPDDMVLFARVLRLPDAARLPADGSPSRRWLARQADKVSRLPRPLQRPSNWLGRLSVYTNERLHLTIEDLVPQCAVLCGAHRGLNPWVVRGVFLLLSEEVTRRLDPLRRYLERLDRYYHDDEGEEEEEEGHPAVVRAYVDRMNALLSLWTSPDVFVRIVGRGDNCPSELAMPRVRSNCEACIVACVGARPQALCDLRAMMCGRSHRRRAPPVLLRLVEAWIERIGGDDAERLLRESAAMTRDVRRIRRMVMANRRPGHHRQHRTILGEKRERERERERERMERELDRQKLNAAQRRIALGGIDRKLVEMFAGESSAEDPQQVDNHEQTPRSSWDNYSFVVDESRGHDGERDLEPFPDYHDDEFDEADPDATYRLQDQIQTWYDRYTEVGAPADGTVVNSCVHPAFSQKVADIEYDFARSQMAMSAVPSPLHFKKDVYPRDGDIVDDRNYDWVHIAPRSEASEWTDVSVHTLETRSTHKSVRGTGRRQSEVPPVPRVPSIHKGNATTATATAIGDNPGERKRSRAHDTFCSSPSSLYSNDTPTAIHPPPAATTVLPFTAYAFSQPSDHFRPVEPAASPVGGKFENLRIPPRVSRSHHRGSQLEATRNLDIALSETTRWPSSHGTSAPSSGSGHRHTSSSGPRRSRTSTPTTTLSSREFQAGLDRMNQLRGALGGDHLVFDENATVLPGDSVSAVGHFYPPEEPGVVHRHRLRRDQITADEALARQLARMDVHNWPRYDTDYDGA